jgi:hypothetical protein
MLQGFLGGWWGLVVGLTRSSLELCWRRVRPVFERCIVVGVEERPQRGVSPVHERVHGVVCVQSRPVVIARLASAELAGFVNRLLSVVARRLGVIAEIGWHHVLPAPIAYIPHSDRGWQSALRSPSGVEQELHGPGIAFRDEPDAESVASV